MEQLQHYATGEEGVVEIESEWTGRKRERMGLPLRAKLVRSPLSFGENSEAEAMGPKLNRSQDSLPPFPK